MEDDAGSKYGPCPVCGTEMYAIRGSARCRNFKDV
jgi:hypothetical protein